MERTLHAAEELKKEVGASVRFYGWTEGNTLLGVMGIQSMSHTKLIRHSHALTKYQRRGIAGKLLEHLKNSVKTLEILVGTWENANWAIRFYDKHKFKLVSRKEKDKLLAKYWNILERQIETSVVPKFKRL